MNLVVLGPLDLGLAMVLVLALGILSWRMQLGLTRSLWIAAARTVVQLLLVGLVLDWVFGEGHPAWIGLIVLVMLVVASFEIHSRQEHRLRRGGSFLFGGLSVFLSTFTVGLLAIAVIVQPDPWYDPRYVVPLFGMIVGNTMTAVSLSMNQVTGSAHDQADVLEQRLLLGETWQQASREIRRAAARNGVMPIINAMATAGLVNLPGMMTGQILGGSPPLEAVKYQILVMLLISASCGFGVILALRLGTARLFDARHRLRLERLERGG